MYRVDCCTCNKTMYWRKGWVKGVSHSFCPKCLNKYRRENGLPDRNSPLPSDIVISMDQIKDIVWGIGLFGLLIVFTMLFLAY